MLIHIWYLSLIFFCLYYLTNILIPLILERNLRALGAVLSALMPFLIIQKEIDDIYNSDIFLEQLMKTFIFFWVWMKLCNIIMPYSYIILVHQAKSTVLMKYFFVMMKFYIVWHQLSMTPNLSNYLFINLFLLNIYSR